MDKNRLGSFLFMHPVDISLASSNTTLSKFEGQGHCSEFTATGGKCYQYDFE